MRKIIFLLPFILLAFNIHSQNNLPYPVIFVHGLAGSDKTFATSMTYLRDHDALGNINVFDIVLNADNSLESSKMWEDVKWTDFYYSGDYIDVGRRNYDSDRANFISGWTDANIFAVNFQEERIRGAWGILNDYFDKSNEAGIFKQGYALGKMIQEVLTYTGADKVVLVGHSMGGLCIREYLQRTNSSGLHTNWVDPYSADGHKVARVATYGTPHLGSNTSPDPTKALQGEDKSTIPDANGDSEANRDLLWEYDSYTNCGGLTQGIYMFGGNENCIKSGWVGWIYNWTFDNVDINCNGSQSDDIVGINQSYYSYDYNSAMPLPLNIKYTYMTSIWANWGGSLVGDGAVNIHRQWLHNSSNVPTPAGLADTTLTDIDHLSEGSDYEYIIRGIDEPKRFDLAYKLRYDRAVIGYITFQQNMKTSDDDVFKVDATGVNAVAVSINGALSGVHTIGVYDASENLLCSRNVSTFPSKLYVNVPDGSTEIYIKISGTATPSTWKNPYTLNVVSGSWVGNISSDWNTATNWTFGVADTYDDVYIPETATNMPNVNVNANCNRMRILLNSKLTINPTASVNVHNDMILDGQIILKSDFVSTASYLDNGNITGSGTVTLERNLQSGGYHYLSAHVSDGSSEVFSLLNNGYTNPNFYLYDEIVNNPDWLYGWKQVSGIMQQAKGYAYYGPYEQSFFKLSGKPNTGNLSISVTNSGFGISSDGWNLIGNPYPSAISALNFINLNNSGVINGAVYLWDDDYTQNYSWEDYGVFNLSGYVSGTGGGKVFNGYIAPGQGFFVKTNYNGNVDFSNSMRSVNNSVFFKKSENNKEKKRLYVNLSGNGKNNNILLAFTDEATEKLDVFYDAERIKINSDFFFYSICDDEDLIIQALPDFNSDTEFEIKLGVETEFPGTYVFRFDSLGNISDNIAIYLKDNLFKNYYNVRENNIEVFINKGVSRNRFSIVFTKTALLLDDLIVNKFNIYNYNKAIIINSDDIIRPSNYKVFNYNGQVLREGSFTGNTQINMSNVSSGIYFVKVVSGKKTTIKKTYIK